MKKRHRSLVLLNLILHATVQTTTGIHLDLNFLDSAISAISPVLSRSSTNSNYSGMYLDAIGMKNQTKCFGEIGCISITEDWFDLLHRPLNLLPFDRDLINTRFIFYSSKNAEAVEVTRNVTALRDAGFEPEKRIKFVIHGFIDTGFSSWVVKLCQQLAVPGNYNVFAVDWGGGSLPFYIQATANTRVVGLELAHFIEFLMDEFNCDASEIHLIGHSLGSHIAGYVGEKIVGLGRITGLDPAEPYFQYMPKSVRLDPSDASFVDVIHSDTRTILLLGYGMQQPCGHVDFYPNDGREQPGCRLTEIPLSLVHLHGLDEVQREIFACNHHRAIYYFTESIASSCPYVGHVCRDYETYQKGQCFSCGDTGSDCAIMGIDADKYNNAENKTLVRFYLTTGKLAPFCVYHYRVNIQLAFPPQAAPWVSGKLKMSITGNLDTIKNIDLAPSENIRIDHGTNITFLLQNSRELGSIEEVRIDWTYNNNYLDIMSQCWNMFCNNKLFVKKIEILDIDELEHGKSNSLKVNMCGEVGRKYTRISSGDYALFQRPC